jgi:hypothetical protein
MPRVASTPSTLRSSGRGHQAPPPNLDRAVAVDVPSSTRRRPAAPDCPLRGPATVYRWPEAVMPATSKLPSLRLHPDTGNRAARKRRYARHHECGCRPGPHERRARRHVRVERRLDTWRATGLPAACTASARHREAGAAPEMLVPRREQVSAEASVAAGLRQRTRWGRQPPGPTAPAGFGGPACPNVSASVRGGKRGRECPSSPRRCEWRRSRRESG